MSVCISSALSREIGMSISHMPMTSSIMQPMIHQIAPTLLSSELMNIEQQQQQQQQSAHLHLQQSNALNHPNPDMLLALLARNKGLEGKYYLP